MTIRLVHGATTFNTQPSRTPETARTARTTSAEDTAAGTQPQGVGGQPQRVDWERFAILVACCLFVSGFWSAIALILDGILAGACLFALPLTIIAIVSLVERFFPRVPDRLARLLEGNDDESRVRTELYRPGRLIEVRSAEVPVCIRLGCQGRQFMRSFCEKHWEQDVDERYEHSWEDPEF